MILAPDTRTKSFSLKPVKNVGGRVASPLTFDGILDNFFAQAIDDNLALEFGSVKKFTTKSEIGTNAGTLDFNGSVGSFASGNVRFDVTIGGNLDSAKVDRVFRTFDIGGTLVKKFQTRSQCAQTDIDDGSPVELFNPPAGPDGILLFGKLAPRAKIRCG